MTAAARSWEPGEEERAFQRLYGTWEPLEPGELAGFLTGYPRPWWVVGGWAIEAFTGVPRTHEDVDLVIFRDDLPALRALLAGRYHLWSAGAGALRPLNDDYPEPHPDAGQVWVREHALAPWIVDCILNPSSDGRWVSTRDDAHVADLEEVTWLAPDGARYLNPEIALLYKAKRARAKDTADLEAAWPLLGTSQRAWLRDEVGRLYPGHAWTELLSRV